MTDRKELREPQARPEAIRGRASNGISDPGELSALAAGPELQQISKSVQTVLRRWASTLLSGDLTAHMDLYAPTVDRFGARSNVTRHFVRAEVERWLSDHDHLLSYRLTDLNMRWFAPEESATTEFRCAWTHADGQSETSHYRLKFRKMAGEWKIVSEEQLSLQSRRRD